MNNCEKLELPRVEKLDVYTKHFDCVDCGQIIGKKDVKAEGEKAEYIMEYYRIKEFDEKGEQYHKYVCPGCVREYEKVSK